MSDLQTINATFYADMKEIILNARSNAVRSVEYMRMMMYWHLASAFLLRNKADKIVRGTVNTLSSLYRKELESEFGSGFSARQLERARKFYRLYLPSENDLLEEMKEIITLAEDITTADY